MAGKILPVALATIFGIATATATFGSELKAQQRKKLEEEYQRDLAALASQTSESSVNAPKVAAQTQSLVSDTSRNLAASSSGLSSLFGLWAWQKNDPPTSKKPSPESSNSQR